MSVLDLAVLIALNEKRLIRETAFVKTRVSEEYLMSCGLSDQNVRHFPNCYPVVAGHAQAIRAIVLKMQEHLIPSRPFGQLVHLELLYRFFASVSLLAVGHGGPLSDSSF